MIYFLVVPNVRKTEKGDIMARHALLKFCPLEYRYLDVYGRMPDYDTDCLIKDGMGWDDASALVKKRLDELWEKMRYEHEHLSLIHI